MAAASCTWYATEEDGGLSDAGEEQARRTGERLKNLPAEAAIQQFAGPPGEPGPDTGSGSETGPDTRSGSGADVHELIVTHNFPDRLVHPARAARPDWRWMGLNQQNCALTVILYRPGLPPSLVTFNDAAHLPDQLRWTGFPAQLRPGCG